jgi:3-mercaptopyruvate sulfurtransferase SseA
MALTKSQKAFAAALAKAGVANAKSIVEKDASRFAAPAAAATTKWVGPKRTGRTGASCGSPDPYDD